MSELERESIPIPLKRSRFTKNTTTYKYNNLEIEQKYLPPADWEFVTRNNEGKVVDKTWWGYEDGKMNIGIYIENFL